MTEIKYLKRLFVICMLSIFISCFVLSGTSVLASAKSAEYENDKDVLEYYREPSLQENFEDNAVNVILKSSFSGLIGLDDFKSVESISEITAITYKLRTIYKGSNEKFSIPSDGKNAILVLTLSTHDKAKVLNVAKKLQTKSAILLAEPNYLYETVSDAEIKDPYYIQQWSLNSTYGIDMKNAWNHSIGDYSVKVGVFEDGADYEHEDLKGRVFKGRLIESTADEHGTHVAGIIGATLDNNLGISGMSRCTMYMLDKSNFVSSLEYAAANNIKIINASFHYGSTMTGLSSYDATDYAAIRDYNGLIICSAGNGGVDHIGDDNDTTPIYPASYDLPNIITVGAIDSNGLKRSSSNYGKTSVDIFAPGGNILSTYPRDLCTGVIYIGEDNNEYLECETELIQDPKGSGELIRVTNSTIHYANGYHYMSGTSMAAPHVTGVAALLMSRYPMMTLAEIKARIMSTVDVSDELSNLCVSGGRLNAARALGHSISYESIGDGQHVGFCVCGSEEVEYHKGNFVNRGNAKGHDGTCNICGAYVSEGHVWEKLKVFFKCKLCDASSKYAPIIFPGTDSLANNLQSSNLQNGQTIVIGNIVILRYDDKYYILTDC